MTDDKRQQRSRKAILDAAIRLLSNDPSAGMADIAAAAGVGRATLYRHYDTKEALVEASVVDCLNKMEIALLGVDALPPRAAIEATFERLLPLADLYRFLAKIWPILENDPEWLALEADWNAELANLMDAAKDCGVLSPDLPLPWLVAFFDGTFEAAWSLVSSGSLTHQEAATFASRSFFNGCCAPRTST